MSREHQTTTTIPATTIPPVDAAETEPERPHGTPAADSVFSPAPNSAAPAVRSVQTEWFVDYHKVVGKSEGDIPDRTSTTQLVVNELKLQPNSGPSKQLHGGNLARSGRVRLGSAAVAQGAGIVSAEVTYGTKVQFDVVLSLDGRPSAAEKKQLKQLKRVVTAAAVERAQDEGDYAAIAASLQEQYQSEFPEHTLSVQVRPLGLGPRRTVHIVDSVPYMADDDTNTYDVLVEPSRTAAMTTRSSSEDDTEATTGSVGTSSITTQQSVKNRDNDQRTTEIMSQFNSEMTSRTAATFAHAWEWLTRDNSGVTTTTIADTSHLKLDLGGGVGGAKDADAKAAANADMFEKVDEAGSKLLSLGKDAVRSIGGIGLDLVGAVFGGGLKLQARLEHVGGITKTTGTTSGVALDSKRTMDSSSFRELGNKLATLLSSKTTERIEHELETQFGIGTGVTKQGSTTKKERNRLVVERETVTHVASGPQLTVVKR